MRPLCGFGYRAFRGAGSYRILGRFSGFLLHDKPSISELGASGLPVGDSIASSERRRPMPRKDRFYEFRHQAPGI